MMRTENHQVVLLQRQFDFCETGGGGGQEEINMEERDDGKP